MNKMFPLLMVLFVGLFSSVTVFASDWAIEVVDDTTTTGMYTAIAVDQDGKSHIIYHDQYKYLWYANNTTGSWVLQYWDYDIREQKAIRIDLDGYIHVVYWKYPGGLQYRTNMRGFWETQLVEDEYWAQFCSLAVDSNSKAHISYRGIGYDLKYATNATGTWVVQSLDADPIMNTAIAVDSNGYVHICYQVTNDFDEDLKYISNSSGSWNIGYVAQAGQTGYNPSLAVDSNDTLHVSYCDRQEPFKGYLNYAKKPYGQEWSSSQIDGQSNYLERTSIAVDSDASIHISYCAEINLRYASGTMGNITVEFVDEEGETGLDSSIALDPSGSPHISYQDASPDWNLMHACKGSAVDYYAIVVGISDYPGTVDDLLYPVADANAIKASLLTYPNWKEANIRLLLDADAAPSDIHVHIQELAEQYVDADDVVLFFFSGHGTNGPDVAPLDEADGLDEYLSAYGGDISDDSFSAWLAELPTSKVAVILDACHSGGMIKSPPMVDSYLGEGRPRVRPGTTGRVLRGDGFAADLLNRPADLDGKPGCVVMTAAQASQSSWEYGMLGHGLFTFFVLGAIDTFADFDSNGELSAEEIGRKTLYGFYNLYTRAPWLYWYRPQWPQYHDDYPEGNPNSDALTLCTITSP